MSFVASHAHMRGGVRIPPKNDDVIYEQPLMTYETFDQSERETWPDQEKDDDNHKDNDKGNYKDNYKHSYKDYYKDKYNDNHKDNYKDKDILKENTPKEQS